MNRLRAVLLGEPTCKTMSIWPWTNTTKSTFVAYPLIIWNNVSCDIIFALSCQQGLSLTCVSIVKAVVCTVSCSVKSYITFMARETPDGDLVEYQAKTEQMPWQNRAHGLFCRPTPKPKGIQLLISLSVLEFFSLSIIVWSQICFFFPPVIHVPRYEDCVSSDSSTDSNASSRGSDQAWDVDSFDDESEYQPPERMCPIEEEIKLMRLYRPKMNRSKVILFYDKLITLRRIIQHLWILKLSLYIGFLRGWRNLPWGNCLFLSGWSWCTLLRYWDYRPWAHAEPGRFGSWKIQQHRGLLKLYSQMLIMYVTPICLYLIILFFLLGNKCDMWIDCAG